MLYPCPTRHTPHPPQLNCPPDLQFTQHGPVVVGRGGEQHDHEHEDGDGQAQVQRVAARVPPAPAAPRLGDDHAVAVLQSEAEVLGVVLQRLVAAARRLVTHKLEVLVRLVSGECGRGGLPVGGWRGLPLRRGRPVVGAAAGQPRAGPGRGLQPLLRGHAAAPHGDVARGHGAALCKHRGVSSCWRQGAGLPTYSAVGPVALGSPAEAAGLLLAPAVRALALVHLRRRLV